MARKGVASVTEASDALRQARDFMSEASGPPESEEEQERLTSTLYALDYASRLAEMAAGDYGSMSNGSEDESVVGLCAEAMRNAALIAGEVGAMPGDRDEARSNGARKRETEGETGVVAQGAPTEQAMVQLELCANTLRDLQGELRKVTLSSVAGGVVSADEAMTRVDTLRRLEMLAHYAWRSAAHLVGRGA